MKQVVVRGGGLAFLTDDVFLIAAVRRCAELEQQLREREHLEVARFRTLRRDMRAVKRNTELLLAQDGSEGRG